MGDEYQDSQTRGFFLSGAQRYVFKTDDLDREKRIYEERSRFRKTLADDLRADLELLAENEPDLLAEMFAAIFDEYNLLTENHPDLKPSVRKERDYPVVKD